MYEDYFELVEISQWRKGYAISSKLKITHPGFQLNWE